MPDVIDAILDGLSLTTLDLLDKIDLESERASRQYSDHLQNSLSAMEDVYLNRCAREMNDKTELIIAKTRKHKNLLEKYKTQFERIHCFENHNDNPKKIKTYAQQIESLEKKLIELTGKSGDVSADDVFSEINEMHKAIEELEMKNKELSDKLECFEDFPANMREAQYCISDIKERIKKKETILECNLFRKNCS